MDFENVIALPFLWNRLAAERRPILLYGTGNGADKIIDEMERRRLSPAGVFASDGFVRRRDFRGMPVTSYSEAIERFGEDVVVLAAFGSPRAEVLDFLDSLSARHTLFIPDVPLFADDAANELFTPEYAEAHRSEIESAAGLFADDESRELFYETLAYRITGEAKYLKRTEPFETSVAELLPGNIRRIVDCGAFTGDTAKIFLSAFPEVGKLICVEPDGRSYRKLAEFAGSEARLTAVNASVGETAGIDVFNASASRASSTAAQNRRAKQIEVRRVTVDMLTEDGEFGAPDGGRLLIKFDVEGAEKAALRGAARTLAGLRPALAVALYHRTADIFEIPLFLRKFYPDGNFALRRQRCVPCWELTLFAY